MLGIHEFELAIAGAASWPEAALLYERFAHPLVPAPAVELAPFPGVPEGEVLSALRRVGGRAQLRTWSPKTFKIQDRWLD